MTILTSFSSEWVLSLVGIVVILIIVIIGLSNQKNKFKNIADKFDLIVKEKEAHYQLESQKWAMEQLEKYKESELKNARILLEQQMNEIFKFEFEKWKEEETIKIRKDAIEKSKSVSKGKYVEHIVPFLEGFPFNPQDARFLGSPIDLIIFDGLFEDKEDLILWIVEIKTGNAQLNVRERRIRNAVRSGRIGWVEINPDTLTEPKMFLFEGANPNNSESNNIKTEQLKEKENSQSASIQKIIPKSRKEVIEEMLNDQVMKDQVEKINKSLIGSDSTNMINLLSLLIEKSPSNKYAYLSRGNIYHQMGNKIDACLDWNKAFNLGSEEAKLRIDDYCKIDEKSK